MRRAWVVLLASCGFKGPVANQVDPDANLDPTGDAIVDTNPDTDPQASCWSHSDAFTASACTTDLRDRIDVTGNVNIDTDSGTSNSPDVRCAAIDNPSICAIAARTIRINSSVILSAHGSRPLALLAHSIDIQGTVDIASHLHGQRGPAANPGRCNGGSEATLAGGGAGGTYSGDGGDGGEQGGASGTAGRHGDSISSTVFRGGCDGGRGGDGQSDGGAPSPGGAGGGGIWIAVDTGILTLGPSATINASGAGGIGGTAGVHGGSGGGSGGLIVLQSPTVVYDSGAKLYANGGHGGGGSQGTGPGGDGTDPSGPTSGGTGGAGGPLSIALSTNPTNPTAATPPGGGGAGFPDPAPAGAPGENTIPGGGGGGGGGSGVILLFSNTAISGPNISPPPAP